MNFTYISYLPIVLFITLLLSFIFFRNEKEYFHWVRLHWFFKRTWTSKVASIFFIAGMFLLMLALLDLRGPEEYVQSKVTDQKTIILIDSSASMLAEDVRPNRFNKALLLARHFVKKSVGHQVSIVVFSDGHKQIVPFTKDVDLMDAKLMALEELELMRGGTGLSMAIQESIQYFRITGGGDLTGNLLIFTDAEETADVYETNIPDSITVAIIGVGTAKGTTIPVRDSRGVFRGNLKYDDQQVVTKLDETFLKKLASKVKNYKYWVASSYSLPTEEILSYFNRIYKIKTSEDSIRIRPVMMEWLIVPAVLLLIISYCLRFFRTFTTAIFAFLLVFNSIESIADTPRLNIDEDKEVKVPQEIVELQQLYEKGKLDQEGRLKLANELLNNQMASQANLVFQESLRDKLNETNKGDYFNWAASQLESNQLEQGIGNYLNLADYLEKSNNPDDQKMLEKVKKNLMKALLQNQQQKKEEKKKKDDQDQENKDQQNQDQQNQDQQNNDDKGQQDQEQEGQNKNQSDNQSESQKQNKEKEDSENKEKDKNDKNDEKKGNKKSSDNKQQEKDQENKQEGQNDNKLPQKQLPALLKQLMSDDNKLQKKFIDAETNKRSKQNRKKW